MTNTSSSYLQDRRLFEIPVYWGTAAECELKQEEPVERLMAEYVASGGSDAARIRTVHESLLWNRGRPSWRYTCVVAWLEVYLHGSRIKIDAFTVNRRRIDFRALPAPYRRHRRLGELLVTDRLIRELPWALRERIVQAAKVVRPGGWADMAAFDAVAEHLDWERVLGQERSDGR